MKKVITYGTYDLLHHGHIRLLERAKALGDYLVVGVTAEDFDKVRGKINVSQSLMERLEAVKATGIADEVIVEEYEGQKIDDIKRLGIDIFTVGSDWTGYFDYLKEYCDVVYLDRTQGVSSTELRAESGFHRMGFIGDSSIVVKRIDETRFINGLEAAAVLSKGEAVLATARKRAIAEASSVEELFEQVDSVYIASHPTQHASQVEAALNAGKHVLCESPIALKVEDYKRLAALAEEKGLVLADSIKTAYATAYHRLKLLVKSGKIGEVVAVDATCTSMQDGIPTENTAEKWSSMCAWAPTALLPAFQLLGTQPLDVSMKSRFVDEDLKFDAFTKIDMTYPGAVATLKVGKGVKSEGELIVTGTKGYIYVPAPWWKTDYFELRFEDQSTNKRYFYQLNGEGIRFELLCFLRSIENGERNIYLEPEATEAIVDIIDRFYRGESFALYGSQVQGSSASLSDDGITNVSA